VGASAAARMSWSQRRAFVSYQEQTEQERQRKRQKHPSARKEPWWKQNDNDHNKGQKPFSGDTIEMAVRDQNIKLLERIMAQNSDFVQRRDNLLMVRASRA
jgi:hypothetical protein